MSSEETPRLSARAALDYATHDELLKLYGILVIGWVGMLFGQFVSGTAGNPFARLIGLFVVLGGVLAFLVGVVAIVCKLLVDSREGSERPGS
jgi:cation transporter-like permease